MADTHQEFIYFPTGGWISRRDQIFKSVLLSDIIFALLYFRLGSLVLEKVQWYYPGHTNKKNLIRLSVDFLLLFIRDKKQERKDKHIKQGEAF